MPFWSGAARVGPHLCEAGDLIQAPEEFGS